MNILLVTYTAYPIISGRITFLSILKKKLEERGHNVDILAHAPGLQEIMIVDKQRIEKAGLKSRVTSRAAPLLEKNYPALTPWIRWRELERYTFEEAIRQFDLDHYDVIHAHDIISSISCQRVIQNKPIITFFHNCKIEEWKINVEQGTKSQMELAYVAREEVLSACRPHHVMVPSNWLKGILTQLKVPEERISVIPYGMDVAEFQTKMRTPTSVKKPKGRKIILCPARLVWIKGHTFLLQALERLKAEQYSFECWLAGNGDLEKRLRQEVEERNLGDVVHFLGARKDIPALMAMADLVVLPTLHDTLPLAVMEAQVAGVPVISTAIGGVPELIEHGKTGLIGPPRDAAFLYHAMRWMWRNPAEASKMAATAKRRSIEQWSVDCVMDQMEEIFKTQLHAFKPRSSSAETFELDDELLVPISEMSATPDLQGTGTIMGTVVRTTGEPIAAAAIHLWDISKVTLLTTSCDALGTFTFTEIPQGKYIVIAAVGSRWTSQQLVVREAVTTVCHAVIEG